MAAPADDGTPKRGLLARLGPGLLVAATGVGAGDLATSALAGARVGTAVLWAVLIGAAFKFVLTEGLARWQLATDETLLEGVLSRVPRATRWLFLVYLVPWSWFVGSALVGACGVTAHALVPLPLDATTAKVVWGVVHSLVGLALVLRGGFAVFERAMGVSIVVMFVTVVTTAVLLAPDWNAVATGIVVPRVPDAGGDGLGWTVALVGGVGGTLTILCYGYWIREQGRRGAGALAATRVDLAVGYLVTAVFGLAMVVIGSTLPVDGRSAELIVAIGARLESDVGGTARWCFLVGAWAAVFSSLVGVWQGVPQIFADFWRLARRPDDAAPVARLAAPSDLTRTPAYRGYLVALALVPLGGLVLDFGAVQKAYAVVGAGFLPLVAVALLAIGRRPETGALGTRALGRLALLATLAFFCWTGWRSIAS